MSPPAARSLEIAVFLDRAGWSAAALDSFDSDWGAGARHYARLRRDDGRTAILMDAAPDQRTPHFVALAHLLTSLGLRAPEIYAEDATHGLVLLEDFGDRPFGALIDEGGDKRAYLRRGTEVLAHLHRSFRRDPAFIPELPVFNSHLFTQQTEWFLDFYMPVVRQRVISAAEREDYRAAWQTVLRPIETMPKSLLLRDFMPDNLMDLPDGTTGLLDFQDAGIGPVAYDLASLCEEIRRDGAFDLLPDIIEVYRGASDNELSQSELLNACTILSAQRHTRILGSLIRLSQTGRTDMLPLLPRVEKHMGRLIQNQCLLPLHRWMESLT